MLAHLGYDLDTALSRPGHWVTQPRFIWPVGTENEKWHGSEHPGAQVFVTAVGRRDSTVFTAAARVLCILETPAKDSQPGSVPTMVKMLSAVQVAGEVTKLLKGAH